MILNVVCLLNREYLSFFDFKLLFPFSRFIVTIVNLMATHAAPPAGKSCMSCWEDISESIYCEYQAAEGGPWLPSGFCKGCIEYLLQSQWAVYTTALAKTTCKAEQRRLLAKGPPINLKDNTALPCPDDSEVHALWFMENNEYRSAKLDGSLTGDARQKFWDEQAAFQFDEPEEPEAAS